MKHLKHISSLLPLLIMFILTGCADDTLQWGGAVHSEDEIAIAFAAPGEMTTVDVATRALTLPSTEIDGLDLLIFGTDGRLASGQYFTKSEFIDGGAGAKAIKIKRQYAAAGTWYLIANAHSKIAALNLYDANGLPIGSPTLADFEENTLTLPEALGTSNGDKALLIARQEIEALPSPSSPAMSAFTLSRRFAKVGMTVATGVEFQVTGISLFRSPAKVKIDGTPTAFTEFDAEVSDMEFFSLPVPKNMEGEPYPEARLIIKGKNPTGRDTDDKPIYEGATDTYFAYKFPGKIESDHDYRLTLKSVVGAGFSSAEEAAENPVGAVIEYKDNYADTKNIFTDGERVIALPDTLRIEPDQTEVKFDVTWRGKDEGDLLFYGADDDLIRENSSVDSSWLKALTASEPQEMADESAAGSDFKRFKTTFTLSLTANEGSAREAQLCFRLRDSEQLLPVLVVEQQSADINLDDSMDIKLEISRGSDKTTIDNYLLFIDNNTAGGTKSEGISPEANGGRIRNAGLHIPMPNGEATYTYTLSGIDGWTLSYGKNVPEGLKATQSGNTYTFTFKDNLLSASSYSVYDDAIILTKDGRTLTLDLYHTGFFHQYGGNWYYYEVFTAGGQQWLDRNIGATSAGMAHLDESSYTGGSAWPMREESAGSRFSLSEARNALPDGWRLPTQGEFETLAMQSGFSSDRFTTGGVTIFLPSYTFQATTYTRAGATTSTPTRAYFPHNRYAEGTSPAGDEGAGYYWTDTNTDNASYYRSMKFVGQNVTPENMLTTRRLSLRCVSGQSVDNSTVLYSCQVKGYTHVFLYAEKNGEKTYLNTWPGTQVANTQTKDIRFNPFSFTSYIDYVSQGYGLYVIFNNPSSTGTVSNVTSEAARARQGIPFILPDGTTDHNGEAYDSSLTGSEKLTYNWKGSDIVLAGNWKRYTGPVEPQTETTYGIKGNFNSNNWDTSRIVELSETSAGSGIWTAEIEVNQTGQFVIACKEKNGNAWGEWKDWGKTPGIKDVELDKDMAVDTSGLGNDNNWQFTNTGKYTLTLNVTAKTLRISKENPQMDRYFVLKPKEKDARKMEYDEEKGVWLIETDLLMTDNFYIQEKNSDGSNYATYHPTSSSQTVKFANYGEELSSTTDSNNLWFKLERDETLFVAFDPVTNKMIVVPTYSHESWWINVRGEHNEWKANNGQRPNELGITTHTLELGNRNFKLYVNKDNVMDNDSDKEHWYGTSDGKLQANEWTELSTPGNDTKITGSSNGEMYKVEFNCWTKKVRVTKVSSNNLRRR